MALPVVPGHTCPFCGAGYTSQCKCMRSDMTCPNGHKWHHQGGEIHAGPSDHGSPVCCDGPAIAQVVWEAPKPPGCPNCGFTSDPETGDVYDVTFPCPNCGEGGASVWKVATRYVLADAYVPAEWFDGQKKKLSDFLGTPVAGQDLAGVAGKIEDMVQTRAPKLDTDEARHKMVDEITYIPGEKDEEGYDKPVLPVSQYGGTNIHEAFAEVFMYYVLGKRLDRDQIESLGRLLKMAAGKPPSKAQIDYAKHLLKQVGGEEPDWDTMDMIEVSGLIDGLKKKRGKPVWYGNGQFSHWEKAASLAERVAAKYKKSLTEYKNKLPLEHVLFGRRVL